MAIAARPSLSPSLSHSLFSCILPTHCSLDYSKFLYSFFRSSLCPSAHPSLSLSLSLSSSILLFLGPGALCKVLQQMTGLAQWQGRAQRRPKHMLTDRLLFQQISHSKRIKKPAIFPTAGPTSRWITTSLSSCQSLKTAHVRSTHQECVIAITRPWVSASLPCRSTEH